jgi:hypothetical protein
MRFRASSALAQVLLDLQATDQVQLAVYVAMNQVPRLFAVHVTIPSGARGALQLGVTAIADHPGASIAAVEAAENHALKPCQFFVLSQLRAIW